MARMFFVNSQVAAAASAMKSICGMMCIVRDCAAKVIKFCLRQKGCPRMAQIYTDCYLLRKYLFATEALILRQTQYTEEIQITFQCFCASVANSFLPKAELIRANLCNPWL